MIWGCQRAKNKLAQHKLADPSIEFSPPNRMETIRNQPPNAYNSLEVQSLKPDHKRESTH